MTVVSTDVGKGPTEWVGEYQAEVIAKSLNVSTGDILTSMRLRLPWYITPELLRHRAFSFSSASTRAIPVKTMVGRVLTEPAMPIHWGKNQKGMQAQREVTPLEARDAEEIVRRLAVDSAMAAQRLGEIGIHKQVANKYLMPFLWCDILVSATEWANFFTLRIHKDAAPEMQRIATMAADAWVAARPRRLSPGEWHAPFVDLDAAVKATGWEVDWTANGWRLLYCSAARCARLSTTQWGSDKEDWDADLDLAHKLERSEPKHISPFEHVAQAREADEDCAGNFNGFAQLRKMIGGDTARTFVWKGVSIR